MIKWLETWKSFISEGLSSILFSLPVDYRDQLALFQGTIKNPSDSGKFLYYIVQVFWATRSHAYNIMYGENQRVVCYWPNLQNRMSNGNEIPLETIVVIDIQQLYSL